MNESLICKASVEKILEIVDAGLSYGLGESQTPGEICVEAAVCCGLGLPHSDDPGCVSQAIRALKIRLNDFSWSSNAARAKGLRRLAIVQLGTLDTINETEFSKQVAELAERTASVALCHANNLSARRSARIARLLASDSVLIANWPDGSIDSGAACTATGLAAGAALSAAAASVANKSFIASDYAASSALASARARNTSEPAHNLSASDKVLSEFAEAVVQILVDLKSPGAQYLYLTEVA
jgi:hypothetical protein